jgi:hypothetical protein
MPGKTIACEQVPIGTMHLLATSVHKQQGPRVASKRRIRVEYLFVASLQHRRVHYAGLLA